MRGPPGVKVFFTDLSSKGRHRPTGGATQRSPSLLPFLERFLPALADSPCFHSHSLWSGMPRCQLESFISKRVLPSQSRTESPPFPETLVPPRPRSHPNSAIGYQTELHCLSCLLGRSRRLAVAQRLVHFPAHPQPVQQHRQLTSHRHHRTLLRILAPAGGQLQPPALQIRIRTAPAQNAVRRLHQQRAQVDIALLADPQLRLALAGFALLGPQAHIAAHVPALP